MDLDLGDASLPPSTIYRYDQTNTSFNPFIKMMEFLGRTLYRLPTPPPRVRDPSQPMQILCVGLPRTGTESLALALKSLGYTHTYHGVDIQFEMPCRAAVWYSLAKKKYTSHESISREDFDSVLGHAVAVTDVPCSAFLPDILHAYPEAKIVLNYRKDREAWQKSVEATVMRQCYDSWSDWLTSWFSAEDFWIWYFFFGYLIPVFWGATMTGWIRPDCRKALKNGLHLWEGHTAYIKSIVPEDKMLIWCVEDGWKPLCKACRYLLYRCFVLSPLNDELTRKQKYLNKPIPDEPFPHANTAAAGFPETIARANRLYARKRRHNMMITALALALVLGVAVVARLGMVAGGRLAL